MASTGLFPDIDKSYAFSSRLTNHASDRFINNTLKPASHWFVSSHTEGMCLNVQYFYRVLQMTFNFLRTTSADHLDEICYATQKTGNLSNELSPIPRGSGLNRPRDVCPGETPSGRRNSRHANCYVSLCIYIHARAVAHLR